MTHQEIDEHALELGLAALEVVTRDEHVVAHRQLNHARDKGVLKGEGGGGERGRVIRDAVCCDRCRPETL